jgi:hypothetical protein
MPLALAAAALAIVAPSSWVADRSDLLLALLVLATALGIPASELAALRRHASIVVFLSVAPLVVLGAVAWLVGRPFAAPTQDGLLAVGLASSEVASVGLVALAGADATIAVGVVTGSLVLSALLGPALIGTLAATSHHGDTGRLLARFALVVILPLAAGVAVRTVAPRLRRAPPPRAGGGAGSGGALGAAGLPAVRSRVGGAGRGVAAHPARRRSRSGRPDDRHARLRGGRRAGVAGVRSPRRRGARRLRRGDAAGRRGGRRSPGQATPGSADNALRLAAGSVNPG